MNSRRGCRRYQYEVKILGKLFGAKRHGRIARIEYIPVRLRPLNGTLLVPHEYNARLIVYAKLFLVLGTYRYVRTRYNSTRYVRVSVAYEL